MLCYNGPYYHDMHTVLVQRMSPLIERPLSRPLLSWQSRSMQDRRRSQLMRFAVSLSVPFCLQTLCNSDVRIVVILHLHLADVMMHVEQD